jgi:hypothetical protein
MMILLVQLEVLSEIRDPIREHRNLHLGRSGVLVMLPVLLHQFIFCFFRQRHRLRVPPFMY